MIDSKNTQLTVEAWAVINPCMQAMENNRTARTSVEETFLVAAEDSFERMRLPDTKFSRFLQKIGFSHQPEFDLDFELHMFPPIPTDEVNMPEFSSAHAQYKFVMGRLDSIYNNLGIIAQTAKTSQSVTISAFDLFWIKKMAEGEHLLQPPV